MFILYCLLPLNYTTIKKRDIFVLFTHITQALKTVLGYSIDSINIR